MNPHTAAFTGQVLKQNEIVLITHWLNLVSFNVTEALSTTGQALHVVRYYRELCAFPVRCIFQSFFHFHH